MIIHTVTWYQQASGAWSCVIRDDIGEAMAIADDQPKPNALTVAVLCEVEEIHPDTLAEPKIIPLHGSMGVEMWRYN